MSRTSHEQKLSEFPRRLAESSRFHMGAGSVHQTVRELHADLTSEGIAYAILDAMALNAHGFARETTDVDVLVSPAGLERFRERFVGRGYIEAFAAARKTFRNTRTGVQVEFITTGEYPGDGKPKPVAFPDPASVGQQIDEANYVDLPALVNLKLASGMTQPARRRDLADVQDLIRVLRLGAAFASELHPYVRETYHLLLAELSAPDPHRETPD